MTSSAWVLASVAPSLSLLIAGCGGDGKSGPESAADGKEIDACVLVTQAEASSIFDRPATRQKMDLPPAPQLIAECQWTWDTSPTPETAATQLIQVYVYDTTDAYSRPADAESYAIGDEGYVRTVSGVDVEWKQAGKTITLAYSSAGAGLPPAEMKLEAMKTQAQKVSERL